MTEAHEAVARQWEGQQLFCHLLPSKPCPEIGRILVTGASGYVGGRLVNELLARDYRVRVMVRAASPEFAQRWPDAEIVVADALSPRDLQVALADVHTAYYLIHSLLLGPEKFEQADTQAARCFCGAATYNGVRRIIYLGGLGDVRTPLSDHLRSRMDVASALEAGTAQVTALRAAVIIGSGSASYEIISNLVRRCPLLPVPRWANHLCQPIAIRDVIKYLVGVLETPGTAGQTFDIGGGDVLSYRQMMRTLAELLNLRRSFPTVPGVPLAVYAYLSSLLTPVPVAISRCLIEGLRNDVICQNNAIRRHLSFEELSFREALLLAMSREDQDRVSTRWSDAYPPAHSLAIKLHEVKPAPRYTARYSLTTRKSATALFRVTCRIGGKHGWFNNNWMWRTRGILDRLLLGVGASRGRRSQSELHIGDVIDFWRVEDLQPDRRLLLRAEMKLPGKAWLEFTLRPEEERDGATDDVASARLTRLTVRPFFETRTLFGKLYWRLFYPFHHFIFTHLIEDLERRG